MCLSEGGFRGRGIGESWATFLGLFFGWWRSHFFPFPFLLQLSSSSSLRSLLSHTGPSPKAPRNCYEKFCIFPGNRECAEHCRSSNFFSPNCSARMEWVGSGLRISALETFSTSCVGQRPGEKTSWTFLCSPPHSFVSVVQLERHGIWFEISQQTYLIREMLLGN